ncbi:MAG: D-glycero-beta-D-manno-heptose-1,7-bisphosphate 7-phosphatase [Gammaproteobacteria bacterium]|nr:MAG: D-glycero-beta-D-manno-heptose-1,7-bisphosphate 7-phosphatase [Gammaproteobacteria bacterium]
MNKPLIILDRDGVINFDSDDYIKSVDEWRPINSSLTAIANLTRAGYLVAVATNQSGLSRGFFTPEVLADIHDKMTRLIQDRGGNLDAIEFCPDHPDQAGPDRKPAPGMLLRLIKQFDANASNTWFVGDTLSDINCAKNAGCKPALVLTGKGKSTLENPALDTDVPVFNNLLSFTEKTLS